MSNRSGPVPARRWRMIELELDAALELAVGADLINRWLTGADFAGQNLLRRQVFNVLDQGAQRIAVSVRSAVSFRLSPPGGGTS